MTTVEDVRAKFESSGYTPLKGLLKQDDCLTLVAALQSAVDASQTRLDEQCPKSPAVYGLPVFDSLMEQLTPYFEQASGKRLHPTYSYARLYNPGEVLRPHTDRPSCEISATLMLGSDGTVWPIYMADPDTPECSISAGPGEDGGDFRVSNIASVLMSPGDAVLYRGMDKIHWRDAFKGEWQAQVFLHYVDADGPHAEWKYDKRSALSHHTAPKSASPEPVYYWSFDAALSPEQCGAMVSSTETSTVPHAAEVGPGLAGVVDKTVRDVGRVCVAASSPLATMMAGYGLLANQQSWKFDVVTHNQTDYLRYDEQGHYKPHTDTFMIPGQSDCRKLTVLLFLNDDFEGGRLFLQVGHEKVYPPQAAGTVLVFPSFLLHGVEPVTSGVRRSVVTWLVGPWFK